MIGTIWHVGAIIYCIVMLLGIAVLAYGFFFGQEEEEYDPLYGYAEDNSLMNTFERWEREFDDYGQAI